MAINNTLNLQGIVSNATKNSQGGLNQSFAPTPAPSTSGLNLQGTVSNAQGMAKPLVSTPQQMTQQLLGARASLNSYTANQPSTSSQGIFSSPAASIPQAPQTPSYTGAPQTPSYTGALAGLQTRANAPSDAVTQSQQALYNTAQNGSAEVQRANKALADFRTGQGKIYADIESTPIPLNFQTGRIGAIQRAAATEEQALTGQVSNALAGQGQQLSALSSNASNALTGQGQQITAQGQVAQYTAPQLSQYGQTYYQPGMAGTAQQGGDMSGALQQYAQMAANGQYSAIPSSITGNPVLGAQLNAMAQRINPQYNPIASTAQGAAQASNIQNSGTYATDTAIQGGGAATQAYNNMISLYGAADTQSQTLHNLLQSTGINSSNFNDYTKTINSLSDRFGSQNMSQVKVALAELQTMYHNLLSAGGGTPSGNEAQSINLLNPDSSAKQLDAAIYQLQLAAQAKLQGQKSLADQYNNQIGGGASTYQQQQGGSGGLYSF